MIAERLRQRIETTAMVTDLGPISITASMGIACIEDGKAVLAILLGKADTALCTAKRNGRNQISTQVLLAEPSA